MKYRELFSRLIEIGPLFLRFALLQQRADQRLKLAGQLAGTFVGLSTGPEATAAAALQLADAIIAKAADGNGDLEAMKATSAETIHALLVEVLQMPEDEEGPHLSTVPLSDADIIAMHDAGITPVAPPAAPPAPPSEAVFVDMHGQSRPVAPPAAQ